MKPPMHVRVVPPQPLDAALASLGPCSWPAAGIQKITRLAVVTRAVSSGSEQAKRVEGPGPCRVFATSCRAWLAHCPRRAYPKRVNVLIAEARRLAPGLSKDQAVVYFLRLRSGMLYVGASTDLEQRLEDHVSGQACITTQADPAAALLRIERFSSFPEARQREAQIKRWSRAKKEALVREDATALRALSRSRD